MKTHEFAKALIELAKILNAAPNMEIGNLSAALSNHRDSLYQDEIAINLATLADLSKVDKAQWVNLIEQYNFDIEIRPRDASRDVIGKLINYLQDNEAAKNALKVGNSKKSVESSPELMRALQSLLKG